MGVVDNMDMIVPCCNTKHLTSSRLHAIIYFYELDLVYERSSIIMIDKQSAQKMREAGHTYKHIAQTIGCSEAWCKQNLSHIVKNTKEQDILAL